MALETWESGPVVPARKEQVRQVLTRMQRVLYNVFGSAEAAEAVDFFQRGNGIDNDSFYSAVFADQEKSLYGLPKKLKVATLSILSLLI